MSEDFVGKVARMGSALLSGTSRPKVALKVVNNYRMAWYFWLNKSSTSFD